MKIGILTYHFSDNYGALFQAYALRKWFLDNGHNADFINYHPDHVEQGGYFYLYKPLTKNNLKILFLKLIGLKEKLFGNVEQRKEFEVFRHDYLGVTLPVFSNADEINNMSKDYDLLVCGSDQIWNPSEHYGVDPIYFLDFDVKGHVPRKISYAPSFGKDSLDGTYSEVISTLLDKLDGISVREKSGCKIVADLIGKESVCVPDPTFLIDDYSSLIKEYPLASSKHVFCYALRSREVIGDVAEGLAAMLEASLFSPSNPHRRWREIGETVYPCPRQWLYLLKNSEYVVTNSFHGTALSILLNKPFIVVGLQDNKKCFNARVENLLSALGLEQRIIHFLNADTIREIHDYKFNWDEINKNVLNLKQKGQSYLLNELSSIKNGI